MKLVWEEWKRRQAECGKAYRHRMEGPFIIAYFTDGGIIHETRLKPGYDETQEWEGAYAAHSGLDNIEKQFIEPIKTSPLWMPSHNLCDELTWWQGSIRRQNITMVYQSGIQWATGEKTIDVLNKRLTNEVSNFQDAISPCPMVQMLWPDGHDIIPTVLVNGLEETYSLVDPENGVFEIQGATQGDTVTVSYHTPDKSFYYFKPQSGKAFWVGLTELNLRNCDLNSQSVRFGIRVDGTEVSFREYQTELDYLNHSTGCPQQHNDLVVYQWEYDKPERQGRDAKIRISDAANMMIVLEIVNDQPLTKLDAQGNPASCVVTIHGTVEAE